MSIITDIANACKDYETAKGVKPTRVYLGKMQFRQIHDSLRLGNPLKAELKAMTGVPPGNQWFYTDTDSEIRVE